MSVPAGDSASALRAALDERLRFERLIGDLSSHFEMKVLYLSGYTDDTVIRRGILPSGVHFQQKPFALHTLARRVRDIIDEVPGHDRPFESGAIEVA